MKNKIPASLQLYADDLKDTGLYEIDCAEFRKILGVKRRIPQQASKKIMIEMKNIGLIEWKNGSHKIKLKPFK